MIKSFEITIKKKHSSVVQFSVKSKAVWKYLARKKSWVLLASTGVEVEPLLFRLLYTFTKILHSIEILMQISKITFFGKKKIIKKLQCFKFIFALSVYWTNKIYMFHVCINLTFLMNLTNFTHKLTRLTYRKNFELSSVICNRWGKNNFSAL